MNNTESQPLEKESLENVINRAISYGASMASRFPGISPDETILDIFCEQARATVKTELEELVTYDSYPLGWHGDKHHRVILAIKGGRIINSAATTDDGISGGRVVTEADVQEYGKKYLAVPRDHEAER